MNRPGAGTKTGAIVVDDGGWIGNNATILIKMTTQTINYI